MAKHVLQERLSLPPLSSLRYHQRKSGKIPAKSLIQYLRFVYPNEKEEATYVASLNLKSAI